jgi:hypothetical protein
MNNEITLRMNIDTRIENAIANLLSPQDWTDSVTNAIKILREAQETLRPDNGATIIVPRKEWEAVCTSNHRLDMRVREMTRAVQDTDKLNSQLAHAQARTEYLRGDWQANLRICVDEITAAKREIESLQQELTQVRHLAADYARVIESMEQKRKDEQKKKRRKKSNGAKPKAARRGKK